MVNSIPHPQSPVTNHHRLLMLSPIDTKGFTLIELLVVLLIMGLLAGLVSAIAQPDARALLRIEAERLAHLLNLATDESRFTGKNIRWTSDGPGYRFLRFREDTGWSEIRDNDLLRPRLLPPGIAIVDLSIESMRPQGVMRLQFTPYSPPPAFSIALSSGGAHYTVTAPPVGAARALPGEGTTHGQMPLR